MRILGIIPARSGSKGLVDKNIKKLVDKPLMAYTIEVALKTSIFDELMVSTDSREYAKIAEEYGASVPFLRDKYLASDSSGIVEVILEVVGKYANMGEEFDVVVILQPTSPLRIEEDILQAIDIYKLKSAYTVSSVCEAEHSPIWMNTLPKDESLEAFYDEKYVNLPRQDLPQYYRENGAVYVLNIDNLRQTNDIYKDKSYAYIMPKNRSVDIDDEMDFLFAEFLMRRRLKSDCKDS